MIQFDSSVLKEWALAIGVLVGMFFVAGAVRIALRSRHASKYAPLLREISPLIGYLVIVLGLQFFGELAPLNPRFAIWYADIVYVVGVLIATAVVRRAAMMSVDWGVQRSPRSTLLLHGFVPMLKNVVTIFILSAAAIFVLKRFGQDVLSLITALGVGSLAVGLAAKDTLANMIAGFTLIIDRNMKPGDRINLAGSVGDVDEIGLRSTRIRTGDGNVLIVPNSDLVNTKILNLSQPTTEMSYSTEIRIPYRATFEEVRKVCLGAMEETPRVSKARTPSVTLKSLADGHQLISLGFWVENGSEGGAVLSQVHETLLTRLKAARIDLAHPAQVFTPVAPG